MSWLKLDIEVVAAHVDAVGDLLLELGASSAAVTPAPGTSGMIVEPDPGATPLWQRCKLSALLPLDVDLAEVHAGLARYAVKVLDTGFLEDANWLERWRQHAVQECFGGRLWLQPRDADPVAGLCLRLNPGLAFGTGGHPTTRMCLQWLAAQDLGGCTLVDYGCGSGVLGLAACVLGAREVVAVDHDPQAWEATRDNARFNGLSSRLTVGDADVCGGKTYDVVVANILAGPLIDLAPRLSALVRVGGRLVLSGLLRHQHDEVVAAYPDVRFVAPQSDGEWICLEGCRAAA